MSTVVPFRTSTCLAKVSVMRGVWLIQMFGEDSAPLGDIRDLRIISAVVQYTRQMRMDGWRVVYGPGADRLKMLIDMDPEVRA